MRAAALRVTFVKPEIDVIDRIVENAREEDRLGIERAGEELSTGFLDKLCDDSTTVMWASSVETSEPLAVWGIVENHVITGRGVLWMVTTNEIEKMKRTVAQLSRWIVDCLILERHRVVDVLVDTDHVRSVRWLQWMGFEYTSVVSLPSGSPAYVMRKEEPWLRAQRYSAQQSGAA